MHDKAVGSSEGSEGKKGDKWRGLIALRDRPQHRSTGTSWISNSPFHAECPHCINSLIITPQRSGRHQPRPKVTTTLCQQIALICTFHPSSADTSSPDPTFL